MKVPISYHQRLSLARSSGSRTVQSGKLSSLSYVKSEPVKLQYTLTVPPAKILNQPQDVMVICHGLYGSKQNWRTLSRRFSETLSMPVYALDMRNHGTSPHAEPHTSLAMANDVYHFMEEIGCRKETVHLMGHSMGGKAVMTLALHPDLNRLVKSLTAVDISPVDELIHQEFFDYADAMLEIATTETHNRIRADEVLQKVEKDLSVRQFLLTNAVVKDKRVSFRIPLELIKRYLPTLGSFPFSPGEMTFERPVLMVEGTNSTYITDESLEIARQFFPNLRLEKIEAGHWVQAEKPDEFVDRVIRFVEDVNSKQR